MPRAGQGTPTPDLRDGSKAESGDGNDLPVGRKRRRRLAGLPWWLGFGLEFSKPGLLLGLLAVLLIGLGLLGMRALLSDGHVGVVAGGDAVEQESIYDGPKAPNYGQELSAAMKLRLARFGIPLHMGPRGVPLLEDRLTGEIREASAFELAIPENAEEVRVGMNPDVVSAPGPGGSVVHWDEPMGFEGVLESQVVSRVDWFVQQEERLGLALRDVTLGAAHISNVDYRRWDDDWGLALASISDALTQKYAFGDVRYWPLAGSMAYCDQVAERVAEGGVTDGCPSVDLQQKAVDLWVLIGHVVETMGLMGKAAQLPYDRHMGSQFEPAEVLDYQVRNLRRIDKGMDEIRVLLAQFRQLASEEGFYVHVGLP